MALYTYKDGRAIKLAGTALSGELVYGAETAREGQTTLTVSANTYATYEVVFDPPMPDNSYLVIANIGVAENTFVVCNIWDKQTTGFKIRIQNNSSTEGSCTLEWHAFKLYTIEQAETLSERISTLEDEVESLSDNTLTATANVANETLIFSKGV